MSIKVSYTSLENGESKLHFAEEIPFANISELAASVQKMETLVNEKLTAILESNGEVEPKQVKRTNCQ
jgi:hypothetical protein